MIADGVSMVGEWHGAVIAYDFPTGIVIFTIFV